MKDTDVFIIEIFSGYIPMNYTIFKARFDVIFCRNKPLFLSP